MEKKAISNGWFYRLYAVCGGCFLLLCGAAVLSCFMDFYIRLVVPAALAGMAIVLILFVFSVKKGVLAIFGECNAYLDDAIEGNLRPPKDEETELALFEVKLSRFVHLQQKAFQDANVQKAQIEALLSDISHQTKTPIANILLYSQLLREKSGENREIVERLVQQSEKLKFLIQTLVEMSRLENGIIKCVPRQENVREFCIQVIGDFYEKAQEQNLDVRLECQNEVTAFFDPRWMGEAAGNILDNAIKYTPEGGRIQLTVTPYQLFVCLEVADSGMGIREEEIPRIFGRFYRGRETASAEGLGIGLYLAREMVTAQKGYIKVLSRPGGGSQFQIFLPAKGEK